MGLASKYVWAMIMFIILSSGTSYAYTLRPSAMNEIRSGPLSFVDLRHRGEQYSHRLEHLLLDSFVVRFLLLNTRDLSSYLKDDALHRLRLTMIKG